MAEAGPGHLDTEMLELEPGDLLVIHPMLAHAGGAFFPEGGGDGEVSLRGFAFADLRGPLGDVGWRRSPNQASQWWPVCAAAAGGRESG